MDTRQLKNFLLLCEHLNFRKTAQEIPLAQPALTRQIQQLEQEIGARLFNRDKKSIKMTKAGEYFRNEADRIIRRLEVAGENAAAIHKGEVGDIHIGHTSSSMQTVLPGIMIHIKEKMRGLKIHLAEGNNRFQTEALLKHEIDIGFAPNI